MIARTNSKTCHRKSSLKLALDQSIISLGAGSIAGAIGVGFAYPIDTIRIKVQVYAVQKQGEMKMSLIDIFKRIIENEGLKGFYSGVGGVMLAQAFIKSAAFGSNAWALSEISEYFHLDETHTSLIALSFAAAFSGFITSFVVNPVERIKVLMQADEIKRYSSELDCASKVVEQDGFQGLLFRGIDATLIREVPGYAFYFIIYSLLMGVLSEPLGIYAPLLCGASAGVGSWIPVYPFDVIKTFMQNTEGKENDQNFAKTAVTMYQKFGAGVFFDGLTPKCIRAAVNHAITFFVFDYITKYLTV